MRTSKHHLITKFPNHPPHYVENTFQHTFKPFRKTKGVEPREPINIRMKILNFQLPPTRNFKQKLTSHVTRKEKVRRGLSSRTANGTNNRRNIYPTKGQIKPRRQPIQANPPSKNVDLYKGAPTIGNK